LLAENTLAVENPGSAESGTAEQQLRRESAAGWMNHPLGFQRFYTPMLVPVLYWLGAAACILAGLLTLGYAFFSTASGGLFILIGMAILLLGPVCLRIVCELLLVPFRPVSPGSEAHSQLIEPAPRVEALPKPSVTSNGQ
jgi:hypothetical protein